MPSSKEQDFNMYTYTIHSKVFHKCTWYKKKKNQNIASSSLEIVQHFKYITLLWSQVYLW